MDGDRLQVQNCQQGDANALAWLRDKCHSNLTNILLSLVERIELKLRTFFADMWSDCVPGRQDRPALLKNTAANATFRAGLATVATNRWID